MNFVAPDLQQLTLDLRSRRELELKQDIQLAALAFGRDSVSTWFPSAEPIQNGDDATALPRSQATSRAGRGPAEFTFAGTDAARAAPLSLARRACR